MRVAALFPSPRQKFLFRFIFFPLVAAILMAGTCVGARADGQQSGGKCPPGGARRGQGCLGEEAGDACYCRRDMMTSGHNIPLTLALSP